MIIAVDAASTDLSLALARPDGTVMDADAWPSAQRQSAELLPRLVGLLDRSGVELGETSAIAVGTGPGSFTGLRVAMALAKGIAVALDRPIVAVPSLAAWLEAVPEADAAVARAGAREAYLLARGQDAPVIADAEGLGKRLGGRRVVAPTELAAAFGIPNAEVPRAAAAIARLAAERRRQNPGGDDLATLEPIYLRAPRGVPPEARGAVTWL
jgi:tRNA threonylcarbamoyladenosine biosynthesis protein TsaB